MNKFITFAASAAIVLAVSALILKNTAAGAIQAVADVNKDTPFEGTGPVGTLGNVTDTIAFGQLSRFGSFLGLQGSKAINFFKTGEFR